MKILKLSDMNFMKNIRIRNSEKICHVLQNTINANFASSQLIGCLARNLQACWLVTYKLACSQLSVIDSQLAACWLTTHNTLACTLVILKITFDRICPCFINLHDIHAYNWCKQSVQNQVTPNSKSKVSLNLENV